MCGFCVLVRLTRMTSVTCSEDLILFSLLGLDLTFHCWFPSFSWRCVLGTMIVVSERKCHLFTDINGISAQYLLHSHHSCSTLVGHQAAGFCPVLSWCSHSFPNRGFTSPLPRILLGVNWRGVFSSETGESTLKYPLFLLELLISGHST